MVNNVINATYAETYDLKTTIGKVTLMGIHTPTALSLKKMYKGFFEQYKKIKINSCDIAGVCASKQSLTPNEVGMEAGKTSPREILDPILFTACTGENLNLLLDQIYGSSGNEYGSIHRIESSEDSGLYYTMLADDRFRQFHPQGGIFVSNLKPFVHKVATTQPFKWEVGGSNIPRVGNETTSGGPVTGQSVSGFGGSNGSGGYAPSVFVSNGLEPMPWIETTYEASETPVEGDAAVSTVLASNIPRVYCGVVVLPPAEYTSLYFRFTVRWHISFKDFRPAYEIGPLDEAVFEEQKGMYGGPTGPLYYNLYNVASKLDSEYGSFDVNGAESADLTFVKGH